MGILAQDLWQAQLPRSRFQSLKMDHPFSLGLVYLVIYHRQRRAQASKLPLQWDHFRERGKEGWPDDQLCKSINLPYGGIKIKKRSHKSSLKFGRLIKVCSLSRNTKESPYKNRYAGRGGVTCSRPQRKEKKQIRNCRPTEFSMGSSHPPNKFWGKGFVTGSQEGGGGGNHGSTKI